MLFCSAGTCKGKTQSLQLKTQEFFASVNMGEQNPFDFFRTLVDGVIAGGTAGVVVETALYPIDTIKTRLQAGRAWWRKNRPERLVFWVDWESCWCLTVSTIQTKKASALFVGVYEPTKQKLLRMLPENLSAVAHLTAGAIGGIAASLIRVPTEVVKQRMQTGQFKSAPDAVRLILSKEGFKGFYAGYGSFLLRDLPFDAVQFCIYEQLRIGYRVAAQRDLNDPENAIIGAFAGALTGAITTPLDVIKTRLMVQGSANQYRGVFDCVQTIVREEGPSALLKVAISLFIYLIAAVLFITLKLDSIIMFHTSALGIGPRVLWIGIGGSIFFGVLESTKRILAQRHSSLPPLPEKKKHS
ncbi:hypothetical protein CDL15_Pgr017304 [Punica granatum]|uniref:S-adenosylmethionine carrier 1, chloroplastic/mitochondrial-like n=1 Tax=Punica granatum TaxID=22663 RepID=A0A218Y3E4_PUNGR|nr:hypothetical protein CDL15_Pgr017304 [Punica granatum]